MQKKTRCNLIYFFFRSRYTYLIKLLQSKYYYIKQFTCLYLLCKCEIDFVKMYSIKTTTLMMCTIFHWQIFHVKFINIFLKFEAWTKIWLMHYHKFHRNSDWMRATWSSTPLPHRPSPQVWPSLSLSYTSPLWPVAITQPSFSFIDWPFALLIMPGWSLAQSGPDDSLWWAKPHH